MAVDWTFTYFVYKKTNLADTNIPVGYPVSENKILLLDDEGEEVTPGNVGEISVRSKYTTPAYWQKPDQTKAAFLFGPGAGRERANEMAQTIMDVTQLPDEDGEKNLSAGI